MIGNCARVNAVMTVSGFDWSWLLKPDQARMPFFADMAPESSAANELNISNPNLKWGGRPEATAVAAAEEVLPMVQ